MGKINDEFSKTVCFIYPSVAEATHPSGSSLGGTGFFVTTQGAIVKSLNFTYVVTNAHVIEKFIANGSTKIVLRVNTNSGLIENIETDVGHWVKHPLGDDIAAYIINRDENWSTKTIPSEKFFFSKEIMDRYSIGVGDDTITFGRFAPHSGVLSNLTSVRFGRIAMNPIEPVIQTDRLDYGQESFIVETYSIGGYSGSPVFVEVEPDSRASTETMPERRAYLLGLDWGHFNIDGRVTNTPSSRVQIPTGMMGVVPAWKIQEVLDSPIFRIIRSTIEPYWEEAFSNIGVDLESTNIDDDLQAQLKLEYLRIKESHQSTGNHINPGSIQQT